MRLRLGLGLTVGLAVGMVLSGSNAMAAELPNILWLTSEDNGPHLGCYGDEYADTPHLDRLAERGTVYSRCWSNAPVCAPARTTIISGMYPPSTGSQHMRSMTRLPDGMLFYPQYLKQAGYYCTNNSKEDYNLEKPGEVWDESSRKAHWRNRKDGQPFFAIFNVTVSHESQIRKRPHMPVHDPAGVRIPAYHPDTPETRRDWAQYYDKLTEMDAQLGSRLEELERAGLADDTIVFYYGDHGSGMPRSKRWPYNSGLHVPLIVHIPEKFAHLRTDDYKTGGRSERLVSFVDLAPTVLSLAGIQPPDQFQGHAFLGPHATEPQPYLYGFRGRMDERYDMVRTVTDGRYVYIRNYMPHKVYGQFIAYMFQTPTTRVWKQLYDEGKLTAAQRVFWEPKPAEELYDLNADPDEVHNLADSDQHAAVLDKLRKAQRDRALSIRDLGFLPEQEIHSYGADSSPYQFGHSDAYPLERVMQMAEQASSRDPEATPHLVEGLSDSFSAVRYWATLGLMLRGESAVQANAETLIKLIEDPSLSVGVTAAHALAQFGNESQRTGGLRILLDAANIEHTDVFIAMLALNALDELDQAAAPLKSRIRKLPLKAKSTPGRMGSYVPNLVQKTLSDLQ